MQTDYIFEIKNKAANFSNISEIFKKISREYKFWISKTLMLKLHTETSKYWRVKISKNYILFVFVFVYLFILC